MCPYSVIEYEIEIVDRSKQTLVERRKQKSTNLDVENLKSFHDYLFVVYALNEFGRSPPSTPILVQTLESGESSKERSINVISACFSSSHFYC